MIEEYQDIRTCTNVPRTMCLSGPLAMSRTSQLEEQFFVVQANVVHSLTFSFDAEQALLPSHPDDDPWCVPGQLGPKISAAGQRPGPPLKRAAQRHRGSGEAIVLSPSEGLKQASPLSTLTRL